MKKTLLLITFLCGVIVTVHSQEKRSFLELSIGGPTGGSAMLDLKYNNPNSYQTTLKNLYDDDVRYDKFTIFGAQYNYSLTDWLNVGAEAGWGVIWVETQPGLAYRHDFRDDSQSQTLFQHYISLMPTATFWYKKANNGKGGIYARLYAGTYLSIGDYQPTTLNFAYQISPLGIYLGDDSLYIFGEVGVGTYYIVKFGIGFNL